MSAAPERGWEAVARLYHAFFTGLILRVASRRGAADAAELVFRVFRRQHRANFLPGLRKLGLDGLPAAVAAAQYHYLSNSLGGVRVEYMRESDRKAWIRYPPPRWVWEGAAICGVPGEVSQAMLRGWHAENGVSLGNPRLGFVCTKQTVDGQDALEGYFLEHDRDLAPAERLRFARGEAAPDVDAAAAPALRHADWPAERVAKARRNYAMEYARTAIPVLVELFGPADARHLGGGAAYLIGLQYTEELKARLGVAGTGIVAFAAFFQAMAAAQGDDARIEPIEDGVVITQTGWRLMEGLEAQNAAAFDIWNALWEGCLAAHDRRLRWTVLARAEPGAAWRLTGRP